MKGFNLYLNVFAVTIIGMVIIGMLMLSYSYLSNKEPKTKTITIEYHGIKTDSINELNRIEIIKIDSLLSSIKETSNSIQERQLQLVKDKEGDSFFNKFYAAMIAIIFAIAGFFGFKSMYEIRTRAIEDAKDEATKIASEIAESSAKKEFKRVFDDEYKAEVFKEATKASTNILRTEIGSLENSMAKLEERIESLESEKGQESIQENEKNINKEANPFDDEK